MLFWNRPVSALKRTSANEALIYTLLIMFGQVSKKILEKVKFLSIFVRYFNNFYSRGNKKYDIIALLSEHYCV